METLLRLLCLLFALAFAGFAAVQLNDPDPGGWAVAYLLASALCSVGVSGRFLRIPSALALLLFLGGALYLSPGFFQEPDWTQVPPDWRDVRPKWLHVETARESAGLMLAALSMVVIQIGARRKQEE